MKELIIAILNKYKETYKLGSDGDYSTYEAVGEEDFDLVADEIIQSLQSNEWVKVEDNKSTMDALKECYSLLSYIGMKNEPIVKNAFKIINKSNL